VRPLAIQRAVYRQGKVRAHRLHMLDTFGCCCVASVGDEHQHAASVESDMWSGWLLQLVKTLWLKQTSSKSSNEHEPEQLELIPKRGLRAF